MGYARSQCLNYGYWHRDKVFDRSAIVTESQSVRARSLAGRGGARRTCAVGAEATRAGAVCADAPRGSRSAHYTSWRLSHLGGVGNELTTACVLASTAAAANTQSSITVSTTWCLDYRLSTIATAGRGWPARPLCAIAPLQPSTSHY